MKKIFFIASILFSFPVYSITVDDLKEPMPIMGRFSNTDKVENIQVQLPKEETKINKNNKKSETKTTENTKVKKVKEDKENKEVKKVEEIKEVKEVNKVNETKEPVEVTEAKEAHTEEKTENILSTFADLSLKNLAQDVISEINVDESKINSDLSILWNATTERSETMKYTIYKLSNPDEDKPNDSTIKKILRPIANISSVAGASIAGDPYMATGALIGGGLINAFMKDDKEVNYKFSKVSDADMVLLIRKIDDLQKKLLDLYVDYKTKEELVKLTNENFEKREKIFKQANNLSKEELTVADVYYRNAKKEVQKATDEFLTSRAILENLVGKEALEKIEEQ